MSVWLSRQSNSPLSYGSRVRISPRSPLISFFLFLLIGILSALYATMMELADIIDLKSIDSNIVRVQIPLVAPLKT